MFRHLEARVFNTDVQLSWSKPRLPMGYSRNNIWYIVQCKTCPRNNLVFGSNGLSKPLRQSDLPFHVNGLHPETRYQFEVFSMNSITENSLSIADYEVAIVTTQKEGSNFCSYILEIRSQSFCLNLKYDDNAFIIFRRKNFERKIFNSVFSVLFSLS